jgi:2-polyprenyl-6-methoxyphenol hydroxylase-like FAD-dependent oxidoreductase
MPNADPHDVIIVGASLAGCTAARLFAQQGLRVALLERHTNLDWHKRVCTHYVQACAIPTVQRLGLEPLLEEAGCVRSQMEFWTRYGWIRHDPASQTKTHGYSVRRQTLDPIVRRLTSETPGVELMLGSTVEDLLKEGKRFVGVRLRDRQGKTSELRSQLVVAADGRNSEMARLANVKARSKENKRFTYFAYYHQLPLPTGDDSQLWLLDPDVAYALPNENQITLIALWLTKDKLPAFKKDRHAAFDAYLSKIPCELDFDRAERISDVVGSLDMPIQLRPAARPGLAFVGDAAFAPDPLWGVGCGWAFQSAEWLVDSTAAALKQGIEIDRALRSYRKEHRRRLAGHHLLIADYASGRRFSPIEKAYYYAAARDPELADLILEFGARRVGLGKFFSPRALGRVLWNNLRRTELPSSPSSQPTTSSKPGASAREQVAKV